MKNLSPYPARDRQRWLRKPLACRREHRWLINPDSLTARLQQRYAQFSVRTLQMAHARVMQNEASLLQLKSQQLATVREVLLIGNQKVVGVCSAVLIPARAKRGPWHSLAGLGNQPLGALLFANPQVRRTPLRYKKLSKHHMLYQKAILHLQEPPAYLWARRSVFYLNCVSILVTEVFLPALHD